MFRTLTKGQVFCGGVMLGFMLALFVVQAARQQWQGAAFVLAPAACVLGGMWRAARSTPPPRPARTDSETGG